MARDIYVRPGNKSPPVVSDDTGRPLFKIHFLTLSQTSDFQSQLGRLKKINRSTPEKKKKTFNTGCKTCLLLQQNAFKQTQWREHTHTHTHFPRGRGRVCVGEAAREELVDRQELNSHSGKREASALKQG